MARRIILAVLALATISPLAGATGTIDCTAARTGAFSVSYLGP